MTSSSGFHRPRRPAGETILYLRGLPFNVDQSRGEVDEFLSRGPNEQATSVDVDDDFFPQSLAAAFSALDEVKGEIASLAGDEYGSQSIEVLAQITVPYSETAARCLLFGCSGYFLHLATHRYGSHVLQTILQLSVTPLSSNDLALTEDVPPLLGANAAISGESIPSLHDLIRGAADELRPHVTDLAVHLCGSHVLRTLFCVLGGVQLVKSHGGPSNKTESNLDLRGRAKSKKKKRKRPTSTDDASSMDNRHHSGNMTISCIESSRLDHTLLYPTLESLTSALLGDPSSEPGELQQLSCHESAGPLLIVLLRVLTHVSARSGETEVLHDEKPGSMQKDIIAGSNVTSDFRLAISKEESKYTAGSLADKTVRQILCWQEGKKEQEHSGEIIYGLSGEPRGSHLLETIFNLCNDEFYAELLQCGDFLSASSLRDYAAHDVSNFVVQTILTTVRTKNQAETLLKCVEKIISCGLAVDPSKKRKGILWRATELAVKHRVEQDGLLKAIRLGFLALNETQGEASDVAAEDDELEKPRKRKKKDRRKASAIDLKDCIPLLVQLNRKVDDPEKVVLDVAGTRAVYHLLRFSPRLCGDVLQGILNGFSTDDMVMLAKDGLGSRCILDGILDGPVQTPVFSQAVRELRLKLAGRIASLSSHRVGHHVVCKLFTALPTVAEKEKLVEELVRGKNALQGSAMGRSVLEYCAVDKYETNKKDWRKKVA